MTATPDVRPLEIDTDDGVTLEAEIAVPERPVAAALLTHPHPQHGGSMQSIVTSELFRALPTRGVAALRFNFRGVGRSTGSYGEGVAERHDIDAGIDALATALPDVAMGIAGWSFGADVALRVTDARVRGWFLVAPPLRLVPFDEMAAASDPRPKRLAVPEHDEFRPPESARQATTDWIATEIVVIAGGDHFLIGRTDIVIDQAVDFLTGLAPQG